MVLELSIVVIAVVGLILIARGVVKLREGRKDRITAITLGLGYLWGAWFFVVLALSRMSDWSTTIARIGEFLLGAYEIESVWPLILGTSLVHLLLAAASVTLVSRRNAAPRIKYLGLGLAVLLVMSMTGFTILSIWVALN